jgi:hypothetical protein
MRRVFKTKHFSRWMRKTDLTGRTLSDAVKEIVCGLIDADLGAGVVKKRVALPGRGKRGGARTLVATNKGIDGSLYSDLRRANEPISKAMNWRLCRESQRNFWHGQVGSWMRQ